MDGENTTRAFARSLAALKRQGCSLLITGPVRDGSHLRLSRRLLGDIDTDRRWRVIVATDTEGIETRCPKRAETHRYRIIDRRPAIRSSAVCARSSRVDLGRVARDVSVTIDEFDSDANGLAPGELRLCVDSLQPLLDTHRSGTITQFIDRTTERVHETKGMGHFHLPVDPERTIVSTLIDRFDVHVELRGGKHRWHLLDDDIQTGWLRI
ncbi:DUF7504 family protein [Halocatena pleomorpha]|uniref:Uncharacterized protein n=1 Tax=Halocatena pleomorpha TaxID=1785090 RepID=A0A3P3RMY0_9EURY|nr:hypothetical protein [Halocatena pleomorpha]RRJ33753.1 hypothetical protein EIK79_02890 [Halocatena pleomorpha]